MKRNSSIASSLIVPALLLAACSSASEADNISTAVAQTVAARETKRARPTRTPLPPTVTATAPLGTLTPSPTKPTPTRPSAGNSPCAQASWIGDTPPDGTIMTPGETFWKTWQIVNTSSCTWNTSYQIIYWNGDLMGGAIYYNFPQTVLPGQTVEVPLLLTAPTADGKYVSEWMFKTPDGQVFGVGEYSVPITAEIEVSSLAHPNFGVTKVEYEVTRDPLYGCPANVMYTIVATVTTNGPVEFSYYWAQWDGNDSNPKTVEIDGAGTKTFMRQDQRSLASNPGTKWMQMIFVDPKFPTEKAYYVHNCNIQ